MIRIISAFAIVTMLISCGGQETEATDTNSETTTTNEAQVEETEAAPAETTPTTPQEVSLEVKAVGETMTDMAYEPTRLEVPAGAKVTLTLVNTAKSAAMIHNVVVIKAGTQEEVATEALSAGADKDFIPENANIIAATSLAQPGETAEVVFTAPETAGTYQFICTYPGHTAMKGVFLVK